jgi:hypothetical protein
MLSPSIPNDKYSPLPTAEIQAAQVIVTNAAQEDREWVSPVPADAPLPKSRHGELGEPSARWLYRSAAGELLHYVCRFDPPGRKKEFRALSLWRKPSGRLHWEWLAPPAPRALYNLDKIAANPNAAIVVCEGEKSADAAERIFLKSVAVASMNGKDGAEKADWSPLAGRAILIWPDLDDAGAKYAATVASILTGLGCELKVIDAASLCSIAPDGGTREPIEKWDAADAIAEWSDMGALRRAAVDLAEPYAPAARINDRDGFVSSVSPQEELLQNFSQPWPKPKPITSALPLVPAFAPDLLPDVLRDYVFDVADRMQCPPDFVAVTALCALAAVIGNVVRIRPKSADPWEVVANLWGAVIGRPSAMKSPAMRAALAPVYALQDSMRKDWEVAQREADIDAALSELTAGEARKKAAKAIKGNDREEAKRLLAEQAGDDEEEKPCPRLIVNDATVEKLGELLNENPRGLLLIRDELPGFLARMESEEHQSERAFYLEAFNGDGSFTYDRIGRGTVHIENCTVSIIGGVQPARIAPLVRGAMTGVTDHGLIQRLQMTVWPDDLPSWTWTDRTPNIRAREAYEAAFRDLHHFSSALDRPMVFSFSVSAQELFKTWVTEIQTEARGGKLPSTLESHLLKMPKTVASLALIFELVAGGRDGVVGDEATARALDWADYLKAHAGRLYAAGSVSIENGARLIIERRAQLSEPFTAREVQRKAWAGIVHRDAVADAIDLLITAGHVRGTTTAGNDTGGRPSTVYTWNPLTKAEG